MVRRADQPGDLRLDGLAARRGVRRDAWLGPSFEALVARIVAPFAAARPDPRLGGWIAELDGRRVGCVICAVPAPDSPDTAASAHPARHPGRPRPRRQRFSGVRLRRPRPGCGCSSMTLWTNDVLASTRRIYEAAGFELVDSEAHHSFSQAWSARTGGSSSDCGLASHDGRAENTYS